MSSNEGSGLGAAIKLPMIFKISEQPPILKISMASAEVFTDNFRAPFSPSEIF